MRTWIIPAASCSRAVAVCAKCAQQTSTRLFGTAPISRRPWIQALEKTAGSGLAELRRHTQNSPVLSTLGVRLPLPAPRFQRVISISTWVPMMPKRLVCTKCSTRVTSSTILSPIPFSRISRTVLKILEESRTFFRSSREV